MIAITGSSLTIIAVIAVIALRLQPHCARVPVERTIDPAARLPGGLADLLDELSREVRTGTSLHAAVVGALARRPTHLCIVRQRLTSGEPLVAALRPPAGTNDEEALVVQALHACQLAGGPVGETLDHTAAALRERRTWQLERRAHSAQARLSASMLTLVPVGFAALGVATSSRLRTVYVESPVATIAALAGLALNGGGWWWMRRIVEGGSR